MILISPKETTAMPQFRQGDMWSAYDAAGLFLITTNSTLKANGALVMGRGIARQARDRFPGLDLALGRQIGQRCGHLGEYYLLVSPRWPEARMGALQACTEPGRSVKLRYDEAAALPLIRKSLIALRLWCAKHPGVQIYVNFPGIGNGRLPRTAVLPALMELPDHVTVWEYPFPVKESAS
jgi:hypothetical protein